VELFLLQFETISAPNCAALSVTVWNNQCAQLCSSLCYSLKQSVRTTVELFLLQYETISAPNCAALSVTVWNNQCTQLCSSFCYSLKQSVHPTVQLFLLQFTWVKAISPLPLTAYFNFLKHDSGQSPKVEWFQTWHSAIRIIYHFRRLDNQNLSFKSPHCLLIMSYSCMLSWQYISKTHRHTPQDTPSHLTRNTPQDTLSHPTRHTITPHKTLPHTPRDTSSHPTRHTVTPQKTHLHTTQDTPSHLKTLQSSATLLLDPHIFHLRLCDCLL